MLRCAGNSRDPLAEGREEEIEHLRREALLRRTTTPEDVAESSCTLLKQEAITGQTFVIRSGQTI